MTPKMTPKFKGNFGSPNSVDSLNGLNLQAILTLKRKTFNRCQPWNGIDPHAILIPKQALRSVIHCEYWKSIVYVNICELLIFSTHWIMECSQDWRPNELAYHVRIIHTKHQKWVLAFVDQSLPDAEMVKETVLKGSKYMY